jgi:hypothetical protein
MPNQCPPVRSTDSRDCYRAGSIPGCTLGLALIAALLGYAGFGQAAPLTPDSEIKAVAQPLHAEAGRPDR